MDSTVRLSKRKITALKQELSYRKNTRSREVEFLIAEAMQYGDLSAGSEYDTAVKEQQKNHDRIAQLENILSHAVEAEEKNLRDDFIQELEKQIKGCGLSAKQAASYVDYCADAYEVKEQPEYGILPDADCLETLKAAQEILSDKPEYLQLGEAAIHRLLRIPCGRWQAAKAAIMECFSCTEDTVNALFHEDVAWLHVTADSVRELANYLKAVLLDDAMAWKIYRNAALLGIDAVKARISAVLDMLGQDVGKKVIRADAEENCWLFYSYYTDPVACIAYMKESGLSPENILTCIRKEPDILYMYKHRQAASYGHNQEQIDATIQRYR